MSEDWQACGEYSNGSYSDETNQGGCFEKIILITSRETWNTFNHGRNIISHNFYYFVRGVIFNFCITPL